MAKIAFIEKHHLDKANFLRLSMINKIIEEYKESGYKLTLRQLYYQLVSRDIIENKLSEYSKLSVLITKGRMAGIVDWDAIEDRLRVPDSPSAWDSPQQILKAVANQYRKDRMNGQENHIEVWVEKDALSGVLKRVSYPFGVALMVNRGYSSTTAVHDAYGRFVEAWDAGKKVYVLYLGDHDPSGIDMVRDIKERIRIFRGCDVEDLDKEFEIQRIALTTEQVRRYNPPPNPAKFSDPRASAYVAQYGKTCWEVDALPPEVLNKLVTDAITHLIDYEKYEEVLAEEEIDKKKLKKLIDNWK